MNKTQYKRWTERRAATSPVLLNALSATLFGGAVCLFGEGLFLAYLRFGAEEKTASLLVTVSLVGISVLLTAIGVFDSIARVAGAGTLVPVTGFANAVASPALDLVAEGRILGVGAGIFKVAGPVLLFGTLAGALYGVAYRIFGVIC